MKLHLATSAVIVVVFFNAVPPRACGETPEEELYTWTESDGKATFRAAFVSLEYDKERKATVVTLRKPGGTVISLPINTLGSDSKKLATKLHEENKVSAQRAPIERSDAIAEKVAKEMIASTNLLPDGLRQPATKGQDLRREAIHSYSKALGCCSKDGRNSPIAAQILDHDLLNFEDRQERERIWAWYAERFLLWERDDPDFAFFPWFVSPIKEAGPVLKWLEQFGDEKVFLCLPYEDSAAQAKERIRAKVAALDDGKIVHALATSKSKSPPSITNVPKLDDGPVVLIDLMRNPSKYVGKVLTFTVWFDPTSILADDSLRGYRLEIADGTVEYNRAERLGNRFGLIDGKLNVLFPDEIGREAKRLLDPNTAYRARIKMKVEQMHVEKPVSATYYLGIIRNIQY